MIVMKIKLLPESTETNISEIKVKAEKIILDQNGKLHSSEEEPLAFGLKSLMLTIIWPDDKNPEQLEDQLSNIEKVSSVDVVDVRRIVG